MNSLFRLVLSFLFAYPLAIGARAQAPSKEAKLSLSSSAFPAGEKIPEQFTCKGANVNPPLDFHGKAAAAKSLALIVDDPDAPAGPFTHWLAWNIAPTAAGIGEKIVPSGAAQGANDFGNVGYGGPCPPSGIHRYFFRLFALDRTLDLKSGAKRLEFDKAIAGHVLGYGELMARFSR